MVETSHLSIWIGNGIFVQLSQNSKKHLAFDRAAVVHLDFITIIVATIFSVGFQSWWRRFGISNDNLMFEVSPFKISRNTPRKFNSSPLKNDAWKITFLLGWLIFSGYVKLPGGNPTTKDLNKLLMREMRLGIEVHDIWTSNRMSHWCSKSCVGLPELFSFKDNICSNI